MSNRTSGPVGSVAGPDWTLADMRAVMEVREREDIATLTDAELVDRALEARWVLDWLDETMFGIVARLDALGPDAWKGFATVEDYLAELLSVSPAEAHAVARVARAVGAQPASGVRDR